MQEHLMCDKLGCHLRYYLLCLLLLSGNGLADQGSETLANDSQATNAVVGDTSKSDTDPTKPVDDSTEKKEKTSAEVASEDVDDDKRVETNSHVEMLKTSVLRISVMQSGEHAVPIKNARVIVTLGDATEYERKTDEEGIVSLSELPYGKVEVDVTSSGLQSDADTLILDEPEESLVFHLKPRFAAE